MTSSETFLFLDTNAYLYSTFSTQDEHDPELLGQLRRLLADGTVTLLLPEVVELEYRRLVAELPNEIARAVQTVKEQLKKVAFPTYLSRQKQAIIVSMDEEVRKREDNRQRAERALGAIFTSPHVVRLPLAPEVMVRSYRRGILGKKPFKPVRSDGETLSLQMWNADCAIVESIGMFFDGAPSGRLVFCSSNIEDFAEFDHEESKHLLDRQISADIRVPTVFYRYLPDVLKCEFGLVLTNNTTSAHEEAEREVDQLLSELVLEERIATLEREAAELDKKLQGWTAQRLALFRTLWPDVVELVKNQKPLIAAALSTTLPVSLDLEGNLEVEAGAPFHARMLSKPANLRLIERTLSELADEHLRVRFAVRGVKYQSEGVLASWTAGNGGM